MAKMHTISVKETEDCFEAIEKWMKKNRYKKETRVVVRGLCEEVSFVKNGYKYFIQSQRFDETSGTVTFEIAK